MKEEKMKTCEACGLSFDEKASHECDSDVLYSKAKQQHDEEQERAEYNAIHEGEIY